MGGRCVGVYAGCRRAFSVAHTHLFFPFALYFIVCKLIPNVLAASFLLSSELLGAIEIPEMSAVQAH